MGIVEIFIVGNIAGNETSNRINLKMFSWVI